MDNCF